MQSAWLDLDFESGSRDDIWTNTGQNLSIAQDWANLANGYTWRWQAYVNWDVQALINSIVEAIKAAGTIVSAIVAVV